MDTLRDYDWQAKVFLFAGLFLIAGSLIGLGCYFNIKSDYTLRNDRWICVAGHVERFTHNCCGSSSCGGGNLFLCEYSYEIGGKQYRSDQLSIGLSSNNEQLAIEERIKNNPVPVWVKANDPCVSVLVDPNERGYSASILLGAISLGMFVGAAVICFVAICGNRNHSYQVLNIQ